MEKKNGTAIIWLGILDILIVAVGLIAWIYALEYEDVEKILPSHSGAVVLIAAIFALASVTFFGIMSASQRCTGAWSRNMEGPRLAIMASVLLVYFFLLGVNVFLYPPDEMSEITRALINNFTYVVGIVVAFYFGSSAYVQAHTKDTSDEEKAKEDIKTKSE